MSKRYKMGKSASKRNFTRNAMRVHPRNRLMPMRGGIRA